MKEIKEILDNRAEITSTWEHIVLTSILLFAIVFLYILKDKIFYLLTMMKIKHIEQQIKKHSPLLKKYRNPEGVAKLDSLLLSLFEIYKTKLPRSVCFDRLFPIDERTFMGELDAFELEVKNRLARYYVLSQNIKKYHETEYGGITITELIRRL